LGLGVGGWGVGKPCPGRASVTQSDPFPSANYSELRPHARFNRAHILLTVPSTEIKKKCLKLYSILKKDVK
jgi:hypothetical protein